ncbi:MAG: hypothetical protein HY259_04280 [Chloroflexi bacterium]|nr:hypothetical protein [Chloroflexota bacterium]
MTNPNESNSNQPAVNPADEPLELPKGALIAFRKSRGGGLRSHTVIVYPDGRVTHGGGDTSRQVYLRVSRQLNDAQIMKMRRWLEQGGFFRLTPQPANPDPSAATYTIAARVGSHSNRLELFDGSIPGSLQPLVQQLSQLLPQDE